MSRVYRFDTWDASQWLPQHHELGRGMVRRENVSHRGDVLRLGVSGEALHGAEIRSLGKVRFGSFEARLRTPEAPGTISAFFLYEFAPGHENDEIDIEFFNDRSRVVLFTAWSRGERTHHERLRLPFDPWEDFHDYRFEWGPSSIRFFADGELLTTFRGRGIPTREMYVMMNVWWPDWPTLHRAVPAGDPAFLEVEEIRF